MPGEVQHSGGAVNPLLGLGGSAASDIQAHVPASGRYMDRARKVIPRGLASRGRLRTVPVVFDHAEGSHLVDIDGNRYVDCVMALGPLLLGHSPAEVVSAVRGQLARGLQFGGQHVAEAELAERVVEIVPCGQKVVFANTGSEAVQSALRIARATTGRRTVVKFDGHYHGWIDPVFVNSPGVPAALDAQAPLPVRHNVPGQPAPDEILVCQWNDADAFENLMARHGSEVAAVIMEPIPFNLGTLRPDDEYLETVRQVCTTHGAMLIFDEVVSGFRVALGGAQEALGVVPDMATYAKGLGAGFPIALVVGSDAAMSSAIDGPVVPGGTYNGSPIAVAAGIATIDYLRSRAPGIYTELDGRGRRLAEGLRQAARRHGAPIVVNQIGSVLQLLWRPHEPMRSYVDVAAADRARIASICEYMLTEGVYAAPRGLLFLSTAHSESDIEAVTAAFDVATQREMAMRTHGENGSGVPQ